MTMSVTLKKYLAQQGIAYDIIPHRYTATAMNAATSAHVPSTMVAKSVILEDEDGYVMAVVPANQHVKLAKVNQHLGRRMGLATEPELQSLFSDCELGAIPAIGEAYGIETIVDDSLTSCPDVYIDAGDHEDFVHIKGVSFRKLMQHAEHATIS